ncbi:MAG: peptidoglycan-binding domain-containing protein [Candidatus Nanopelagicales bacterium]|nr:peptidoglycan-binding domain-containing protein [Candidatus Nanopelagicales bacterium]MDZ4248739.1 peptidoglycan-binding domain-containing protein [Candidatus Nanopelagicales bacterium]MDZ7578553.1 peptidoglycan-binding domain-containing protein [Candidatus Nanopelagicales bacterium]
MKQRTSILTALIGLLAVATIAPVGRGTGSAAARTEAAEQSPATSAAVLEGELKPRHIRRRTSARWLSGPSVTNQSRDGKIGLMASSSSLIVAARRAIKSSPLIDGRNPRKAEFGEPYVPQESCVPIELPGVAAFREFLLEAFPRPPESLWIYNILRGCDVPGVSEHEEGRALDFEADQRDPVQLAQATRFLKWLTAHKGYQAKRFGIMYVIYRQKIWASYKPYWRHMSSRGNRTANHRDHIHFSFTWNGALKRTSYWKGKTSAMNYGPCPVWSNQFAPISIKWRGRHPRTSSCPGRPRVPRKWRSAAAASLMPWKSGGRVMRLQEYLVEQGLLKAEPTGTFGAATYRAIRRWQKQNSVPRTGVWDVQTQHQSGLTFVRNS